jgi:L-asparaginase/Glu-tRNA(Gln) amidotransferase subunit D
MFTITIPRWIVLKLDGLRGLILETFGAGNAPSGQDNAMINVLAHPASAPHPPSLA